MLYFQTVKSLIQSVIDSGYVDNTHQDNQVRLMLFHISYATSFCMTIQNKQISNKLVCVFWWVAMKLDSKIIIALVCESHMSFVR